MNQAERAMNDAIVALMPIVRREAAKLKRTLPASVTLDDLEQAGRVAAWRAVQAFDGSGSLEAFACQRIQRRLLDYLRDVHPAGRSGKKPVPVSSDVEMALLAAEDDPAAEVQRAQEFEAQMKKLSPESRKAIEAVLAGKPSQGVSAARVTAMLDGKRDRTPAAFDPATVQIRRGMPVPTRTTSRPDKSLELINRMAATDSVLLAPALAETVRRRMRALKIRCATFKHSATLVEVWREPSEEQLAGARKP